MTFKPTLIFILILTMAASIAGPALSGENGAQMIENTKIVMGTDLRIQIPVSTAKDKARSHAAIHKAFKKAADLALNKASMGAIIDKMAVILKECGVNNAFINSSDQIYSLGMKSDKEMWKAWVPHPTDKHKVYAILRLKDRAIVTVRNDALSASVVADDAASAEKLARGLLSQGVGGMKAADLQGVDALLIIKDGKKFRTEMAGGFKAQYGKAKKR